MQREALIALVQKIAATEGTEQEIDNMIELLEANVNDPEVTNYIFYSELSAEEIVDKCLSFKATPLWPERDAKWAVWGQ